MSYDSLISQPLAYDERPLIGITGNFEEGAVKLLDGYCRSVEAAGGIALVLPPTTDARVLLPLLDRLDGLLLSGGADVNPVLWGEDPVPALGAINADRDEAELLLARLAYDRQLPIFGICRGMQLLALALGGSVHQDLATSFPDANLLKHSQQAARHVATHFVDTESGSLLEELLGERLAVNSFHHQAVNDAGPHLAITARAADGVAEGLESMEHKAVFAVQWHPECFLDGGDASMLPLFRRLVEKADCFRRARRFHDSPAIVTLDSHCDTPMFFSQGVRFETRDPKVRMDFHKMSEGRLDAVVMAAYLAQGERTPEQLAAATAHASRILGDIETMVRGCEGIELAYTPADLYEHKRQGLKSVMMGIENGYALGRDLANVERFRQMGVVYLTLCHNGDNDLCDSARRSNREHGGLSDFGRDVVREMNRVGMLVDLSHAAEETFYQALELSEMPVVCSHSSCRSLCDHPRNLTDDQLRALAETGGVAQITFYEGFLRREGRATVEDILAHLLHAIEVAGIDHVGFGSDFDGDGGVPGCADASEVINLTARLLAEGLSTDDLEKIWGKNFLRVMTQAQA